MYMAQFDLPVSFWSYSKSPTCHSLSFQNLREADTELHELPPHPFRTKIAGCQYLNPEPTVSRGYIISTNYRQICVKRIPQVNMFLHLLST